MHWKDLIVDYEYSNSRYLTNLNYRFPRNIFDNQPKVRREMSDRDRKITSSNTEIETGQEV